MTATKEFDPVQLVLIALAKSVACAGHLKQANNL